MTLQAPQAWKGDLGGAVAIDLQFEASTPSKSRTSVKPVLVHGDLSVVRCDLGAGAILCQPNAPAGKRYAVVISHGGGVSVSRGGVTQQLKSGEAVLLRSWEPSRIDCSSAFRVSLLSLSCDGLDISEMNAERAVARGIARDAEGLVLLRRYLVAIEKEAGTKRSPEAAALIARHIQDLLLLALTRWPGDLDKNVNLTLLEMRLDAVEAYLESNFRDPSMSVSEAAAALGISPRYVERLLQGVGTTFSKRLIELRLDEAYRQLRDAELADRSVETVALSSGFTNAAHFSRRFRARFGYPPSELRELAAGTDGEAATKPVVPAPRRKPDKPAVAGWGVRLDEELADEVRKAAVAGERALAASALKEAVSQFRVALSTLRRLPPLTERDELELDCQLGIVSALVAQRGYTDPQTSGAYRRAETLCRVLNLEQRLANVEDALYREHLVRADYDEALRVCERSQRGGRDSWLIGAAIVRMHQGKLAVAGELFDRAIPRRVGRADGEEAVTPVNFFVILGKLVYEALFEVLRGEREASRALMRKAIDMARNSGNTAAMGFALSSCTRTSWLDGNDRDNLVIAQELADLCRGNSFAYWGAVADCHLAWHAARADQSDAAAMISNGIERYRRTGARWLLPYLIALQAEIDHMAARHDRAMQHVAEARALADELGEHWYDAALLSLEGDILAAIGRADDARRARQNSRMLARKQGARLFLSKASPGSRWGADDKEQRRNGQRISVKNADV
ncbi:helix-turn-helix domain-containing protein [Bradyrhizobium sp. GCM10027634]|uniref:helix-turn-helix domain-containing protein n=1 Tax=unclassified Bradyrhizobium TaxID=2631580 RepID=UPI00188CAE98|nr:MULTISPECIES: AraC family transcriptional regulator [unclassified Bradyrhizobium]MDN5000400.1 AraC family transcriptional regulator [Bradyrhizobium sp. WYCCWR 12677]QOZ42843.1 hypothetical protein XH89_04690 [Bradyrhizobium sp. CCBAU 53340]